MYSHDYETNKPTSAPTLPNSVSSISIVIVSSTFIAFDTMFSVLLFAFLIILFVYSIVRRQIEQNAEYFRSRNIKYKGFSFSISSFISMFFGKADVLTFTQRNYNAVPTEP